jgi:hypothetical protein
LPSSDQGLAGIKFDFTSQSKFPRRIRVILISNEHVYRAPTPNNSLLSLPSHLDIDSSFFGTSQRSTNDVDPPTMTQRASNISLVSDESDVSAFLEAVEFMEPEDFIGFVFGGGYTLQEGPSAHSHYHAFRVEKWPPETVDIVDSEADQTGYEARVYNFRNLSSKCRRYRLRSMGRLASRVTAKVEQDGFTVPVFRIGNAAIDASSSVWRGTTETRDGRRPTRLPAPAITDWLSSIDESGPRGRRESKRLKQRAKRHAKRQCKAGKQIHSF